MIGSCTVPKTNGQLDAVAGAETAPGEGRRPVEQVGVGRRRAAPVGVGEAELGDAEDPVGHDRVEQRPRRSPARRGRARARRYSAIASPASDLVLEPRHPAGTGRRAPRASSSESSLPARMANEKSLNSSRFDPMSRSTPVDDPGDDGVLGLARRASPRRPPAGTGARPRRRPRRSTAICAASSSSAGTLCERLTARARPIRAWPARRSATRAAGGGSIAQAPRRSRRWRDGTVPAPQARRGGRRSTSPPPTRRTR